MPKLTFKFDPNQQYQLDAIQNVVDLFDGLRKTTAEFTLSGEIVANLPEYGTLHEHWLLDNLQRVQHQFNEERPKPGQIDVNTRLDTDDGLVIKYAGNDSWRYPSFTIEMETGTGKTYVYLRTIHELRKHYGFSKFIVIVPTVAIYEGLSKASR